MSQEIKRTPPVPARPKLVQHLQLRCLEKSSLPPQATKTTRTAKTSNDLKTRSSLFVSLVIPVQVSQHKPLVTVAAHPEVKKRAHCNTGRVFRTENTVNPYVERQKLTEFTSKVKAKRRDTAHCETSTNTKAFATHVAQLYKEHARHSSEFRSRRSSSSHSVFRALQCFFQSGRWTSHVYLALGLWSRSTAHGQIVETCSYVISEVQGSFLFSFDFLR